MANLIKVSSKALKAELKRRDDAKELKIVSAKVELTLTGLNMKSTIMTEVAIIAAIRKHINVKRCNTKLISWKCR